MALRVLLVNEWGGAAGGTESYLQTVAAGLARRGLHVGLLYARRARPPMPAAHWSALCPGLQAREGEAIDRAAVVAAAAEFRPDIVHVNRLQSTEPTQWLAAEFPTVAFLHDHFPLSCPGFGKFLKPSAAVCGRRVGPFCAVAPWVQGCGSRRPWVHLPRYAAVHALLARPSRVRRFLVASRYMQRELLSNGVEGERIRVVGLPGPEPWGKVGGGNGILYAGRLTEDKGPAVLIEALGRMKRRPLAVFAGEGPLHRTLSERASDLGLDAEFPGWLEGEGLRHAFESAAIVVVPSLWPEPFGLVGLEAMAAGRPVVAFDRGGISEWLSDGETGRLLKDTGPAALAEALQTLLGDAGLRARFGQRAQGEVTGRFSEGAHLDHLLAEYNEALRQRPG
jgi:glycosyltransferase involved in cell wall biosynthesis